MAHQRHVPGFQIPALSISVFKQLFAFQITIDAVIRNAQRGHPAGKGDRPPGVRRWRSLYTGAPAAPMPPAVGLP